jgi:hypothetical protein
MTRFEQLLRLSIGWCAASALLCVAVSVPRAVARPMYDDDPGAGVGSGCVTCHNGFQGGNGVLHARHRNEFIVGNNCNLCHPDGGGSVPVLTYSSDNGNGLGCAGCHGHDYGEFSSTNGQPKATAYGLREFHVVQQGITSCGTSSCHQPGALGHSDPFPPLYGENVPPPYYGQPTNTLTDPCSSLEEDLTSDVDTVGLDNDGDGLVDAADPDCPSTTTSTSTTSTTSTSLPFVCGAAPAGGCIEPEKGVLLVNEKVAGKEKLKVSLKKLQGTVAPGQFGDPVAGTTVYKVCVYDGANQLSGEYTVARAGDTCDGVPCWSAVPGKGYKYKDSLLADDGVLKIIAYGGDPGMGKAKVIAKNSSASMPTGVAAALQDETSATVQVVTSDASCFGVGLSQVKKADGTLFSAVGP